MLVSHVLRNRILLTGWSSFVRIFARRAHTCSLINLVPLTWMHREILSLNAQQRRTFNDEVAEYNRLDNIALSELIKACRQNVKVKNLSESGEFNTAFKLLQRLRQRYYTVDDITKAKHMLNHHALN